MDVYVDNDEEYQSTVATQPLYRSMMYVGFENLCLFLNMTPAKIRLERGWLLSHTP